VSEQAKKVFYGERPPVYEVLMNLYQITGSESCAIELLEAADEVEQTCEGAAFPSSLPCWCFDGSL
jgi:hypothetical protein